jgi:hypothetical protein
MVANNFLGLTINDCISLSLEFSDSSMLSCCFGDKEKKATSDPEIKAEKISNIIRLMTNPINEYRLDDPATISRKNVLLSRGSK